MYDGGKRNSALDETILASPWLLDTALINIWVTAISRIGKLSIAKLKVS